MIVSASVNSPTAGAELEKNLRRRHGAVDPRSQGGKDIRTLRPAILTPLPAWRGSTTDAIFLFAVANHGDCWVAAPAVVGPADIVRAIPSSTFDGR